MRDWLFVEDHCGALDLVLRRGKLGETYNIGASTERTNLQVVTAICAILDRLCPDLPHRPCTELIRFVADRPGHDRRYAVDAGKLRAQLGWAPQVEFEAGLEQTVRWYLAHPEWPPADAAPDNRRRGLRRSTGAAARETRLADAPLAERCPV